MNYKEKGLLEKRLKRCIATILSVKDKCEPYLTESLSIELRQVILDQMNDFYLLVVDLIDDNLNQEYIDLFATLNEIKEAVKTNGSNGI